MYEVELKLRADHEAVRERLAAEGATARGAVRQRDTYYDAPHRDFDVTDEALRIRRVERDETVESRLTYKGPLVDDDSKTRREHETVVEDGETAAAVFEALGFSPAAEVRKRRERFVLDGYLVTLDAVEGVGEFVEVEGEAAEDEIDRVRDEAAAVVERLGLDPEANIRTSYLELLLEDSPQ
ncbi:MAG: class IV adenylate cyclase [Haloferacaceae archaeon]